MLGGVATPEGCWVSLVAGVSFAGGVFVDGIRCVVAAPEYGGTTAPVSSSAASAPPQAARKRTAALTSPNRVKTFPISTLTATPDRQFTRNAGPWKRFQHSPGMKVGKVW